VGRVVTFLFGLLCATLFVACATVHVLSLVPGTVLPMERIIWLHVLALLAVFAVGIHVASVRKHRAAPDSIAADPTAELEKRAPSAVWTIFVVLFVYAILNFGYFAVTTEGQAGIKDNKYVLRRKSRILRELNEAEYHEQQRFELRAMSGHWMMFGWAATAYFLFVAPRLRRELENAPAL
jgi:hypothetical protein